MKILITTDLYTTATNGVVTSVRNLMDELTKKGHEIRVLTVSENLKSHKDENIYYIKSLPLGVIYPDVRMPISHHHHRFIQELIDWKPDLIHSQCEFFSYQFAQYISRKTAAPIVHTYHTLYEQYVTYIFPTYPSSYNFWTTAAARIPVPAPASKISIFCFERSKQKREAINLAVVEFVKN